MFFHISVAVNLKKRKKDLCKGAWSHPRQENEGTPNLNCQYIFISFLAKYNIRNFFLKLKYRNFLFQSYCTFLDPTA